MLAALVVVLTTLELIRRRKLCEKHAMIWLAACAVLVVFAIWPKLLLWISQLLGIYYLTTLFLMVFSFLCLMIIYLTVVISQNSNDTCRIVQKLSLLEQRIEQIEKQKKEE